MRMLHQERARRIARWGQWLLLFSLSLALVIMGAGCKKGEDAEGAPRSTSGAIPAEKAPPEARNAPGAPPPASGMPPPGGAGQAKRRR
jgi:hypothetical protein